MFVWVRKWHVWFAAWRLGRNIRKQNWRRREHIIFIKAADNGGRTRGGHGEAGTGQVSSPFVERWAVGAELTGKLKLSSGEIF